MTTPIEALKAAAQALIDRWDTPLWKDVPHTATYIDALRAALAQAEARPAEPLSMSMFASRADYEAARAQPAAETDAQDAKRWRWLADDMDGDAQCDFITDLNRCVYGRGDLDKKADAAIKAKP